MSLRWGPTAATAPLEFLDKLVVLEILECLDHQATLEPREILDHPAPCLILLPGCRNSLSPKEARRVLNQTPSATFRLKWAQWASEGLQDHLARLDHKASKVHAENLETLDLLDHQVPLDPEACLDLLEKTEKTETTDHPVLQDLRALLAPEVCLACQVFLERKGTVDSQAWMDLRARWDRLE